jgi:hypothetical protein
VSLSGSFTDSDNDEVIGTANTDQFVGTVNYGDGSGVQPLILAPDNTFRLQHVYHQEGNYTITVTITGDGVSGFASVPVEVYAAGVDITEVKRITAPPPGGYATDSVPGMTATLFRDNSAPASATTSVLIAPVTTIQNAYDIRSVDLKGNYRLVVTFDYPPGGGTPSLVYFNSVSGRFEPVLSSTPIVIDTVNHTVTLTLDANSTPQLGGLTGTVFVVEVPQTQPSPPAVPPPSPLPPPSLSEGASSSASSATAGTATTGTATAGTATAGTATITPVPFLATSLPSGTVSEVTPASSNAQTSSNNSSLNQISAFSPFVLIITGVHPGVASAEAGAGADLGPNVSTASAPEVLPLLNRLPRVPVAEESTPPPDSGPNAVLSPSRAGLPQGADKPETPAPLPAPAAPPPANNAPPLGFEFHPGMPALRLATASTKETEEGTDWFGDVLSAIFDRLPGLANGQDNPLQPAVAVLALCAGLAPHVARPRKDARRKEKEKFDYDRRQGLL